MSARKIALRTVPVQANADNLPSLKTSRSKSAGLFQAKKSVGGNKNQEITSFFASSKSSKQFDVFEEDTENFDVFMVDKEVEVVPTTSDVGCQTDVDIEGHYEDPNLTIDDLTSIRPTVTVYRRRVTKLQKEAEEAGNYLLEVSIKLSQALGKMHELEDDIKLARNYEIGPEDIEEDGE
uniref:Uncharacterized protein n=1 Tax=Steinernema glaseri TaxID=37863 RepID=A0A1I7YCP9_9BILA